MDFNNDAFDIIVDKGITFILAASVVILLIIYIPKLLNLVVESMKDKKDRAERAEKNYLQYYQDRQKQYDEQNNTVNKMMETITQVASQGNVVIENNSRIIESNTQVVRENQVVFSQVTKSLDELSEKVSVLQSQADTNRHLNNKILTKATELDVKLEGIKEKLS